LHQLLVKGKGVIARWGLDATQSRRQTCSRPLPADKLISLMAAGELHPALQYAWEGFNTSPDFWMNMQQRWDQFCNQRRKNILNNNLPR